MENSHLKLLHSISFRERISFIGIKPRLDRWAKNTEYSLDISFLT